MRIKEVENATGLTAKAIRLYESKGLLHVRRESESDYRDYTQEDVRRLKNIALLRQLDVPIRSIKDWTDGKCSIQEILRNVCEFTEGSKQEILLRQKMANDLLGEIDRYGEENLADHARELEELNSILDELGRIKRMQQGHLLRPVFATLYALGPVGMTLIWLQMGKTELAVYGFVASLIGVLICAFSWNQYRNVSKSERSTIGCLSTALMVLGAISSMIFVFIGVLSAQTALYVHDPSMIMVFRQPWSYLIFLFELEIIGAFQLLRKGVTLKLKPLLCAIMAALVLNGVLLYGCVTGVSVASDEGITRYSFWEPEGKQYRYEDIVHVETGFGGKFLGIPMRNTGTFYYKITYRDGTVENWGQCSSEREDEDSWEWMIRLDERVMDSGAEKSSNEENAEFCDMEQRYVDMLLRVIRNR